METTKVRELLAMMQVIQDPRRWRPEESQFLELEEYGEQRRMLLLPNTTGV